MMWKKMQIKNAEYYIKVTDENLFESYFENKPGEYKHLLIYHTEHCFNK